MNATQALTQLRKLLGTKAGISDSRRASTPEQREAARAKRKAAVTLKEGALEAMEKRRRELLTADEEYQRQLEIYRAADEALKRPDHHQQFRYEALINRGWCNEVVGEADTLAELVEVVRAKQGSKVSA